MKKNSILLIILAVIVFSCQRKFEAPVPKCNSIVNDPVNQDPDNDNQTLVVEDFATSILENPEAGKALGVIIAKASDDKLTLHYELKNQSVANALSIDASTGALTVNDPTNYNFKINPTITAECVVTAGAQRKVGNITITLTDVIEPFVTKWKIGFKKKITIKKSDNVNSGRLSGYNIQIDWGDDKPIESFDDSDAQFEHQYTKRGEYEVTITGTYPGFSFYREQSLLTVVNWGDNQWKTMDQMFAYCNSFKSIEATEPPNLSQCTSLYEIFYGAEFFNDDLNQWETSNIRNMTGMFFKAKRFNGDITNWNTGKVTDMHIMFHEADLFNRDISNWNTINVKNMNAMFHEAPKFNQDISSWKTNNVTDMSSMFDKATAFNQNIKNWKVANVKNWFHFAKNSSLRCYNTPSRFSGSGCTP